MIRMTEAQDLFRVWWTLLSGFTGAGTALRGETLTTGWRTCSRDTGCSVLSNPEPMTSTLTRPGLKERRINTINCMHIFVGIKVIVAYSAHIHSQAMETINKETLQTVSIFHVKNTAPCVSAWRSYRKRIFVHNPIEMERCLRGACVSSMFTGSLL